MTEIEAVVFDWGGTLTPWHEVDLRASWQAFAAGFGTMACALNDLTRRLVAAEEEAWHRARTVHVGFTIEEILRSVGVDPDSPAGEAGLAAYWDFWEPHSVTHRWVDATWEGLRHRGVRVGVLSNTPWPRSYHDSIFARDGVAGLLDAAVYSGELGLSKPHPEAFEAALAAVRTTADRAIYVGDRLHEDIWGAQQVGLRTVLLQHRMFAGDHVVAGEATPDAVIDNLEDLLPLVDSWRVTAG